MSIISERLKTIIELQGAIHLRTINVEDLNKQVNRTDIKGAVLGVHTNIPEVTNETFEATNRVVAQETIEVHYLQLSEIDATGDQTQAILDNLRPYADGLYDMLQKDSLRAPDQRIDGYELDALESIKFSNEVLTGWKVSIVFPIPRSNYECNVLPPSQEALDVVASFPYEITQTEKTNVITIVDAMVLSGNWDKVDNLCVHTFTNRANSLWDWKRKQSATDVNNPTHTPGQGFLFNGVDQYLNTNFTPSVDGVNYQLNDAHMEVYCYENLSFTQNATLFGVIDGTNKIRVRQQPNNFRIFYNTNSNGSQATYAGESLIASGVRYGVNRIDSASEKLLVNGDIVDTTNQISTGMSARSPYIGGVSSGGSFANPLNARTSHYIIGGGFDLTELKTELDNLENLFIA